MVRVTLFDHPRAAPEFLTFAFRRHDPKMLRAVEETYERERGRPVELGARAGVRLMMKVTDGQGCGRWGCGGEGGF